MVDGLEIHWLEDKLREDKLRVDKLPEDKKIKKPYHGLMKWAKNDIIVFGPHGEEADHYVKFNNNIDVLTKIIDDQNRRIDRFEKSHLDIINAQTVNIDDCNITQDDEIELGDNSITQDDEIELGDNSITQNVLYHITPEKHIKSILECGLQINTTNLGFVDPDALGIYHDIYGLQPIFLTSDIDKTINEQATQSFITRYNCHVLTINIDDVRIENRYEYIITKNKDYWGDLKSAAKAYKEGVGIEYICRQNIPKSAIISCKKISFIKKD